MKKWFTLLLTLCLCMTVVAIAETAAPKLTYEPEELDMPAVGLMIYVPADLNRLDGDEVGFDLGLRYNAYNEGDTFELAIEVHDSRDLDLAGYAAFYADRYEYSAVTEERINGFYVQRLTKKDKPEDFVILLAMPDDEAPQAVYSLSFICDGEKDVAIADEILGTLALYGY